MAHPKLRKRVRQEADQPWERMRPVVNKRGNHEVTIAGDQFRVFGNHRYTALLRIDGPVFHISIRRNDRRHIFDWRDMQRIKNELMGPEHEAVQIFPAESRLADTANQYHLWGLTDPAFRFPFGFSNRTVSEADIGDGARQRPFDPGTCPDDAIDAETLRDRLERLRGE